MSKQRIAKKEILVHLTNPATRLEMRKQFFKACQKIKFRYSKPVLFSKHRDLARFADVFSLDESFESYYANWCFTEGTLFSVRMLMEQWMADQIIEEQLLDPLGAERVRQIPGCEP